MTATSDSSAAVAGPNGLLHSAFDFRNRFEVGPDPTVEHSAKRGVVEATATSDSSDALGSHSIAETDDKDARDFGDGVFTRFGGPRPGTQVSRGLPRGAGHDLSVDAEATFASSESANVSGPEQGGDYYHHGYSDSHLSDEVRVTLNNYVPRRTKKSEWLTIRELVRQAVAQSWPETPYETHVRLRIATDFVLWATNEAGMDADRDVFNSRHVDRYATVRLTAKSATSRRQETRLRLIAAGALADAVVRSLLAGTTPVAQPYTASEVARYASWGAGLRQEWRRRNAAFILGLGLGAGLESREMKALRTADVEDGDDLMTIHVRGANARSVPVRQFEAGEIRTALAEFETGEFLLTEHMRQAADMMAVMQVGRSHAAPNSRRLRSTWIVSHLNSRSPLPEFLAAAGLTSTAPLLRYMPYVDPTPGAARLLAQDGGVK
jgi:hypothetical protein